MSTPADDEEQALVRKHGRPMCDSMAGSLKKEGAAGYKHVNFNREKGCYIARVFDIDAGKQVYLGSFTKRVHTQAGRPPRTSSAHCCKDRHCHWLLDPSRLAPARLSGSSTARA